MAYKLFLDMDSFFASIEQQVQPPLRNKPVGVAPYTGETGCIISPSKLAKEQGVKTGMLVGEAKKLCPAIKIIESRPVLYKLYHQEIVKVLYSFSPFLKILSIDEMTFPIEEGKGSKIAVQNMALKIKEAIKNRVGDFLTCSIGIGPNQFLAKIAAELEKPDGLVWITKEQLPCLYKKLDLLDLPGINEGMKRILYKADIRTPFDFYQASQEKLVRFLNHPGRLWYLRLRGFEVDDYKSKVSSIGHSFVLPPKYRNKKGARKVVIKLAYKIGQRLRRDRFLAGGLLLKIDFVNGECFKKFVNHSPFSDVYTLIKQVLYLLSQIEFKSPPLSISMSAYKLLKDKGQHFLFPQFQKRQDLFKAVDAINDKYGPETVYIAETEGDVDIAPERIPFGKPR